MATTENRNGGTRPGADLEAQIEALKSDVSALTATLAEYGRAQKAQFTHAAQDRVNDMAEAGIETAELARKNALDAYAGAERTIRANPATSVGLAVGAGFLAGLLASRR